MKSHGRLLLGGLSALVMLVGALSWPASAAAEPEHQAAPALPAPDENLQPVSFDSVPPSTVPPPTVPPSTVTPSPKQARQQAFEQGIEEVRRSGILQKALGVGDKAIDFELPSANGTNVRLSEMLAVGPVVVTFYRGNWCPYCNRQLQGLQEVLLELHSTGAQLLAISPELPEQALATERKDQLAFPVLSDKGNIVARKYGIVFHISDKVIPYYDQFFNIEEQNGDRSYELPLAATYVIGGDGVIRYAFFDADYKLRADPQEILSVLRQQGSSTSVAGR